MKNSQAVLLFAAISLMSNYESATASICELSAFNKWEATVQNGANFWSIANPRWEKFTVNSKEQPTATRATPEKNKCILTLKTSKGSITKMLKPAGLK